MTDLLSRLAARTLGAAPLARALITPVFSPDPGVTGAFVDATDAPPNTQWLEAGSTEPAASARPASAPANPVQPSQPTIHELQAHRRRHSTPDAARGSSSNVPALPLAQQSPKPEQVRPLLEQKLDTSAHPPIFQAAESPLTIPADAASLAPARIEPQVILVPVYNHREVEDDSAIQPLAVLPESPSSPDQQPQEQISGMRSMIRPAVISTRRQQESATHQAQLGEVGLMTSPSSLPSSTHDGSSPTPGNPREMETPLETTIHVTIGRVDVRLVQPSAAAAQRAAPVRAATPPSLTLDEYLKQRNERRP